MTDDSDHDRCRWFKCHASMLDHVELCWYHYDLIGRHYFDNHTIFGAKALATSRRIREEERASRPDPETMKIDRWRARSVVYYVRTGDHVKIGYTIHLPSRVNGLRLDRDSVLAVEPGWRETEAERHTQFADERQGRRENFNPSRRLMAHIDVVRSKYGEPWAYASRRVKAAGSHAEAAT